MIDFIQAQKAFQNYISSYDMTIPSIRLKVVHTYKVVECCEYLCHHLHLSKEDTSLAMLIALLHDIGRFEQIKRFNSFDDRNIDHAKLGVQVLFKEGMIRNFIDDDQYDEIIEKAIAYHDTVAATFDEIRYHIDKLEEVVDNEMWPLPKYRELLFIR